MTWISGTADNYLDLLADIATIVTANGGHVLEQTSDLLWFYLEGDSGTDQIYCGIQAFSDVSNNRYNYSLIGAASWRSGRAANKQPLNSLGETSIAYLWNSSIPYWIAINKRRIIIVAKISTVYQTIYLGLMDVSELAIDKHYPYPMLIGGSGTTTTNNYSTTTQSAFWNMSTQCGRFLAPGGRWGRIAVGNQSTYVPIASPYSKAGGIKSSMLPSIDGLTYRADQIYLADNSAPNIYGAIDGIFRISGHNNSAENVVTIDGSNYMVFPDTYRTSIGDYCCIKME